MLQGACAEVLAEGGVQELVRLQRLTVAPRASLVDEEEPAQDGLADGQRPPHARGRPRGSCPR
jgi:hypothetical protein